MMWLEYRPSRRNTAPFPPSGAASYVVGPGDVLEVIVLDQEDVSRSTTVQSDGIFTMPLLGGIAVAGKTVGEIQKLITEMLSRDFLVNPSVEVRVREFASQFALVMGEVVNPGQRALRGNTRLIDLLIESGGFRPTASGEILVTTAVCQRVGDDLRDRIARPYELKGFDRPLELYLG